MWHLLAVSPFSLLGLLAAEHAGAWGEILAPLGAAAPFAALAVYVIRRQETVVDGLTAELRRVNDLIGEKFLAAIADSTALSREQTRILEQVWDELRRRP